MTKEDIIKLKQQLDKAEQKIHRLRQENAHFSKIDEALSYKTCLERQIHQSSST